MGQFLTACGFPGPDKTLRGMPYVSLQPSLVADLVAAHQDAPSIFIMAEGVVAPTPLIIEGMRPSSLKYRIAK
jgi:hypothetical protein